MNDSSRNLFQTLVPTLLMAGYALFCAGCQSLPRSNFDPNGERLFESCPLNNLNPFQCDLKNPFQCDLLKRKDTSATPIPVPSGQPTLTATPVPQPTPANPIPPGTLPGYLSAGRTNAAVPQYGSTATSMDPNTRSINTALIYSPEADGSATTFESTGGYALPTEPVEGPALLMTPREQIAPVGSEVVLISSYLGNRDRLVTNEKIEWSLEGVGSILNFDRGSCCDPLFLDFTRAKKSSDRYAITKTSQVYQHLDRGTPETRDDIHLLRGQTWVSVNSMKEGTTHVTAFAPSLKDWSKRSDFGIIHWVDAQWILPRLPLAPTGDTRMLTTTVQRRTNGQARCGWIVQYEILSGPQAGFGSSGAQIERVPTDSSGQASVLLQQRENRTGTNTIAVKIIRPAGVDGSDREVTVGNETVHQTWSGNAAIVTKLQGPREIRRGQDAPYTITLTNTTSTPATGYVEMNYSPTASLISSNPPVESQGGSTLIWSATVPANSSTTIQVILRSATTINAHARFHPQGSPYIRPSIPTTPVPPSGGWTSDPSTSVPTVPGVSASVYPGTPSPGSTTPGSAATVFAGANLNLEIQPVPNLRIEAGKSFDFLVQVDNRGTSDLQGLQLRIPVPAEIVGRKNDIAGDAEIDNDNNVILKKNVSLPRGQRYSLRLRFPTIPAQGLRIRCEAIVGTQVVQQTETTIRPN